MQGRRSGAQRLVEACRKAAAGNVRAAGSWTGEVPCYVWTLHGKKFACRNVQERAALEGACSSTQGMRSKQQLQHVPALCSALFELAGQQL